MEETRQKGQNKNFIKDLTLPSELKLLDSDRTLQSEQRGLINLNSIRKHSHD